MARHFTTGENIVCSIGSCGPVGSGAYTMVWLYKIDLFAGVGGLGTLRRSGASARDAIVTGNRLFGLNEFSGNGFPSPPASVLPEETWVWVAQRKAAGAAHYEWAYGLYPIADPDTDVVFGEDTGAANHSDPGAGDEVWIGLAAVSGNRELAVMAMFDSRLSDAVIKSIFTEALSDLMAAGPVGCWPLNQADTADDVIDVTGNGADQTSITGTAVADDPDGYSYDLTPETNDGVLAGVAPMPTAALAGDVRIDGVLAASLPLPVAALTGDVRIDAVLAGRSPLPRAALTADLRIDGVLAGVSPMPTAHLFDEQPRGRGPRATDQTPGGRYVHTTPAGRTVQ